MPLQRDAVFALLRMTLMAAMKGYLAAGDDTIDPPTTRGCASRAPAGEKRRPLYDWTRRIRTLLRVFLAQFVVGCDLRQQGRLFASVVVKQSETEKNIYMYIFLAL